MERLNRSIVILEITILDYADSKYRLSPADPDKSGSRHGDRRGLEANKLIAWLRKV